MLFTSLTVQTKHIKMLGTRSCLHLDIIRKLAHCVQKVADPCATGHFKISDGDLFGLSHPSVCRIIKRVSQAIASKKKHFITFPCGLAGLQVKQ